MGVLEGVVANTSQNKTLVNLGSNNILHCVFIAIHSSKDGCHVSLLTQREDTSSNNEICAHQPTGGIDKPA